MSKHRITFEIDVEKNGSFIGRVVEAEHESWEVEDVYAVSFSCLHFVGLMFANLEQLPTFNFPASLISDFMLSLQTFVEKYLNQDGIVKCSCDIEEREKKGALPFIQYTQGFTQAQLN